MLIKFIYTLFLAILVALFVGLGIDAFYQGPKAPEYPTELNYAKEPGDFTLEQRTAEMEYEKAMKNYMEESKPYNRNVSVISLIAAILILILSLSFFTKIKMIADGILLGGVFTAMYSIIRGMESDSPQFRFLIVIIGLAIALVLGYAKFIRPKEKLQQN